MITEKEFEQIKVVCDIASLCAGDFDSLTEVIKVKDVISYIETLVDRPKCNITNIRTPDNAIAPFGGKDAMGNQLYAGRASGVCPK